MWRHSGFKCEPIVEPLQRKLVVVVALSLILSLTLTMPFEIRPAEASGTIYIKADGSIEPLSAPISTIDKKTYLLTGKINDEIVVQRNNVTIDGNNQTVQGTGGGYGFTLNSVTGVWLVRTNVKNFISGIWLFNSNGTHISENNIAENLDAISLYSSQNNTIERNNVTRNSQGIYLSSSQDNSIRENNIDQTDISGIFLEAYSNRNTIVDNVFNDSGLLVQSSYQNSVEGNTVNGRPLVFLEGLSHITVTEAGQAVLINCSHIQIENLELHQTVVGLELFETTDSRIINSEVSNNYYGIWLYDSSNNSVMGNNLTDNTHGIELSWSSDNRFFHNNIVNNSIQVYDVAWGDPEFSLSVNAWDDGYPSGGNYWGNYTDTDVKSGPNQDITGSDGIVDAQHQIDENNRDQYSLIAPFTVFDAGTWNGTAYNISIESNSGVSNLQIDTNQQSVTFDIAASDSTYCFCRAALPNIIVQDLWHGNFRVLLNNEERPFRNWTDATNTYVYINYQNSEQKVAIVIPEYPSIMIFVMFATVSLLVLTSSKHTKKRLRRLC